MFLERLRCNGSGQVFTAEEPEGIGPDKYDETAGAMIAQLKYGSGTPFYRLAQLEQQLGIPLPRGVQERANVAGGKLKILSGLDSGTGIELTIPASRAYSTSIPPAGSASSSA